MTPVLASDAPTLPDHPEFVLMVQAALRRFHCTIGELREDYWLGRAWRALLADPALQGRIARIGIADVLLLGPRHGPATAEPAERAAWARRVESRVRADTAHEARALGIGVRFADGPVDVAHGCLISLLAQAVRGDPRWVEIDRYAADLSPVLLPVAYAVGEVVAA